MTDTFDKLMAILKQKGDISREDIEKMTADHGSMTEQEIVNLESAKLEQAKQEGDTITMDQYLAALAVLDSVPEGSDEYKKAEALVDQYESGG